MLNMNLVFRLLCYLFLLAVAVQFLLAGLAVMGGEDIEAHRLFGFIVMHIIPLLMFGAAISVKAGRVTIGMTLLLFVLVGLQSLWVEIDPMSLRAIHVLAALVIYVLGHHIAQRAGRLPLRPAT